MVAQEFLVLSVGVRIPAGLPSFNFITQASSNRNYIYSPGGGGRSKGLNVGGGGGGGGRLSNAFSVSDGFADGTSKTSPRGIFSGLFCSTPASSEAKGSKGAFSVEPAASGGED